MPSIMGGYCEGGLSIGFSCSKQGQAVKIEAEPSIDAIGNGTATIKLTSYSPFFPLPPTKWSESSFSFMAIK